MTSGAGYIYFELFVNLRTEPEIISIKGLTLLVLASFLLVSAIYCLSRVKKRGIYFLLALQYFKYS